MIFGLFSKLYIFFGEAFEVRLKRKITKKALKKYLLGKAEEKKGVKKREEFPCVGVGGVYAALPAK